MPIATDRTIHRMPAPDLEAQIAEIQSALLSRTEALGALVADTVWRELPFYAEWRRPGVRQELEQNSKDNLRFLFEGLTPAGPFDTTVASQTGSLNAKAGVPLHVLMDAYRIACRVAWEEIVALASTTRRAAGCEALIRSTARIWMAQDVLTQAAVAAYRDETTRQALAHEAERTALVEALMEGRIVEQATLWEVADMLRLPVHGPFVVVAAECGAVGRSALPGIESKLSALDLPSAWRLLPDVQIGLVHVGSDAKFELLQQTLTRAAATRIGVSSRFDELGGVHDALTYARIALSAERPDGSLLTIFEDDPLAVAAVSAPRVMKRISLEILNGFDDLDERERNLLFTTFRTWVSCDGSIKRTAEQLFCHPNTVRHRLKRIEAGTGMSLTRPRDLAELCLAFEINLRLRSE